MPELEMDTGQKLLDRIDEAIKRATEINTATNSHSAAHESIAECVTICEAVYGAGSIQLKRLNDSLDNARSGTHRFGHAIPDLSYVVLGTLQAIRQDIAGGRIERLLRQAVATLILDFTSLAERALDEGQNNVAAVLAAAAFEDFMRRRAQDAGVDVSDKDLSEIVNALKAAGLLGGTQAKVAASYVPFRNKALHAEWEKIASPEIAGLIAFVKNAAASPGWLTE